MNRRAALLVSTLLAAFLAAGCSYIPGLGTSGGGSGVSGAKPIPGGGGGGIVDPAPGGGAAREEPDPTVADARPTAIDHFVIGPDGRTVTVYYWGGNQACFGLQQIEVAVVNGVPTITIWEGTRAAAVGMACTMEALLKSAVIVLDEPMLIDGSGIPPTPGEAILPDQPLIVTPSNDAIQPHAVALIGSAVSADGLTLTVHFVGGLDQCYAVAAGVLIVPDDGGSAPIVTIREGGRPGGPDACDDIGVAKAVVVTLSAPLVLDGSAGPQPPAS